MSKPLAAPPDVIRWVSRSGDHDDCAVAALALACGVTYELALKVALSTAPELLNGGMRWGHIRRTAQRLGCTVRTMQFEQIDLSDESQAGILELDRKGEPATHVVYLWLGRIIDPKVDRRELWDDPEMFFSHYGYTVGRLLVVTRED